MIDHRDNVERRERNENGRGDGEVARLASEAGWALGLFVRVAADRGGIRDVKGLVEPRVERNPTRERVEDPSSCDSDLWVG